MARWTKEQRDRAQLALQASGWSDEDLFSILDDPRSVSLIAASWGISEHAVIAIKRFWR